MAATCCLAITAATASMLVANYLKPVLMPRYLLPFLPFGTLAVALLAAKFVVRKRAWFPVILLNATLLVGVAAYLKQSSKKSDALAQTVGNVARACSTTKVIAIPHWMARGDPHEFVMKNEPAVVALGYRMLGREYGFTPATRTGVPRTLDPHCPTIVWSEHYFTAPPNPLIFAKRAGLLVRPELAARAVIRSSSTGFIVSYFATNRRH